MVECSWVFARVVAPPSDVEAFVRRREEPLARVGRCALTFLRRRNFDEPRSGAAAEEVTGVRGDTKAATAKGVAGGAGCVGTAAKRCVPLAFGPDVFI